MKTLKKVTALFLSVLVLLGFSAICLSLNSNKTAFGQNDDTKEIVIHYSGITKEDEIIRLNVGETLDFADYEKEGYSLKVVNENFEQISEFVVSENETLNFIYKDTTKKNAKVIILAGQSNAAGVGRTYNLQITTPDSYYQKLAKGFDNVFMSGYSHGHEYKSFQKVRLDYTVASTDIQGTFGPEIPIAERLSEAYPDENIYIVKTAVGGLSLDFDFKSPSAPDPVYFSSYDGVKEVGWLYNKMIDNIDSAFVEIEKLGYTPQIAGFMWFQGEAEASSPSYVAEAYGEKFDAMISDLKAQYKDNISPDFAVYDASIKNDEFFKYGSTDIINAYKKSKEGDDYFYFETNTNELSMLFEPICAYDFAHFDATSYIDLGHDFANAFIKKNKGNYTPNKLEIETVNELTISLADGKQYLPKPIVKFNGEVVDAELFFESSSIKHFSINEFGRISPLYTGKKKMKIIAFYKGEVKSKVIDLTIV